MLDSIINNMRDNRLLANEEYDRKDLLETIKKHLKDNIDILNESFEYDYKKPLDEERLLKIFDYIDNNNLGVIDSIFRNDYGKIANNYVPYGIVGVVIRNDIDLYSYAAIINVLIQSNNSIIIELYRRMGTVNILIELINQILEQIGGINKIFINNTGKELINNSNLDLLIYVGDKADFYKINNNCEKKYYGIGNYELIVDTVVDKKLLDEAKKNNVKIIKKEDKEDFYITFNKMNSNYCTGLMSDNKKEIKKFIADTKSSYLLINALPTLQSDINIDINDLIYRKSVLIGEDNKK